MKPDYLTRAYISLRETLFRSAVRYLRNEDDAKDIMHDSFLNLIERDSIQSDSEAKNKLFVVLRNKCIDSLREVSRRNRSLDSEFIDRIEDGKDYCYEDVDAFESLIQNSLSDSQREIYRLIVHDGMEYEEVAARTGRSVEAIRMTVSRIRKKIRENIKKYDL